MAKKILGTIVDIHEGLSIVDINKLKASCSGVILRLGFTGYGSLHPSLDKGFLKQYEQLHKAGIPVGCYYFTIAYTEEMAKEELQFILDMIQHYDFELPIILDVEQQKNSKGWTNLSIGERTQYVKFILDGIEAAGYYTMVYGSTYGTFKSLVDDSKLQHYDHWIAQYAQKNTYTGPYNLWQYSSKADASAYGLCQGSNCVDVSNMYIDYPAIIKNKGLNQLKAVYKPVPVVTAPEVKAEPEPYYHKVVKGDTLSRLAIRYKTTVEQIVADNIGSYPRMTKNYIVVGWLLKVR